MSPRHKKKKKARDEATVWGVGESELASRAVCRDVTKYQSLHRQGEQYTVNQQGSLCIDTVDRGPIEIRDLEGRHRFYRFRTPLRGRRHRFYRALPFLLTTCNRNVTEM